MGILEGNTESSQFISVINLNHWGYVNGCCCRDNKLWISGTVKRFDELIG